MAQETGIIIKFIDHYMGEPLSIEKEIVRRTAACSVLARLFSEGPCEF